MRRLLFTTLISLQALHTYSADFVWFDGQHPITYQMPKRVDDVVKTALYMWMEDMTKVTGLTPVQVYRDSPKQKPTLKLSFDKSLPPEAFQMKIDKDQLYLFASTPRGMAYAILELSRLAGVSPWIWWGDVTPQKKNKLTLPDNYFCRQEPSVQLRGIFINDEDWSIRPWATANSNNTAADSATLNTNAYERIFQLLLRLRGNALWPAMHPGTTAFFNTPGAVETARRYGIVIGSSHCEPMLRNNVAEWNTSQRGAFNYLNNRQGVKQYWIERLKDFAAINKNGLEAMFTIGMRGIHDGPMEGYSTAEERFEGLQQVINDQQKLLQKHVGQPERLIQVFVPYKEVLQLYDKGLKVPDYVTLLWCDDNYGYITRLSDQKEQTRGGGAGVYYHLSYWGRPHDYLWLTTTQPGLIYNEMQLAYKQGARKLWIVNVHDPKVAAYDLELFLDMAWNIQCVNASTLNNHLHHWLARDFGNEVADRLYHIMHEFYRLCAIRKPEFMGWNQVEADKKLYDRGFTPIRNSNWTEQERDYLQSRFSELSQEVELIEKNIDPSLRDAFFTAIKYPIQAAAAHCEKMIEAEKARRLTNGNLQNPQQEKLIKQAVARSFAAWRTIHKLTDIYNHQVAGGKWNKLMCDHPRDLPVFWAPLVPIDSQDSISSTTVHSTTKSPFPQWINACDFSEASEGTIAIQMLGHSMNAVALNKGGKLSYRFHVGNEGDYTIQTALIPTQPIDKGDLRFSVSIDNDTPIVFSIKEPFRSEGWKNNVLNAQTIREIKTHLAPGKHILTITALDEHIIVDQWRGNWSQKSKNK